MKVLSVQIEETFFVQGLKNGNFSKTVAIGGRTDMQDFTMDYLPCGDVLMTWTEGNFRKGHIIPNGNIKGIALMPTPVDKTTVAAIVKVPNATFSDGLAS